MKQLVKVHLVPDLLSYTEIIRAVQVTVHDLFSFQVVFHVYYLFNIDKLRKFKESLSYVLSVT